MRRIVVLALFAVVATTGACGPNNLNHAPLTPIPAPAVTR